MSDDLDRILDLPVDDRDGSKLVDKWTSRVRRPGGEWTLRPPQALALEYIENQPGAVGAIGVGVGKTLIAMLSPIAAGLDPDDVLVLAPAELRDEADQQRQEYLEHFEVPDVPYMSYTYLSHNPSALEERSPSLIVADECHKLANKSSARTGRFLDYFGGRLDETKFVPMSGTLTRQSLMEFRHLVLLALREQAPMPDCYRTARYWARGIDAQPPAPPDDNVWREVGELADAWADESDGNLRERARVAFRRRFEQTPGIVLTDSASCDQPIRLRRLDVDPPDEVTAALQRAREVWELPGDEEVLDQLRLVEKCRQLAAGFYYRFDWNNGEPDYEWLDARSAFRSRVRRYKRRADPGRDTHGLVVEALENGEIHFPEWDDWKAVRDREPPPRETVWVSDYLVDDVVDRADSGTIVWYNHRAVGEKLADRMPTAMAGEKPPESDVVALSVNSHSTGFNLQDRWHRNIVLSPPSNGGTWEQLIGRTHRPGQDQPVEVEVYCHTPEFQSALDNGFEDAEYMKSTQSIDHRLLIAEEQ